MNPIGTATDDIDLTVRLEAKASMALAALAVTTGKSQEQLVVEALTKASERWERPFRSATSRAGREGRYVGHAWGQHVRWRVPGYKRVKSAKARAVMRARRKRRIERYLAGETR